MSEKVELKIITSSVIKPEYIGKYGTVLVSWSPKIGENGCCTVIVKLVFLISNLPLTLYDTYLPLILYKIFKILFILF